jgi:hypothetical protein
VIGETTNLETLQHQPFTFHLSTHNVLYPSHILAKAKSTQDGAEYTCQAREQQQNSGGGGANNNNTGVWDVTFTPKTSGPHVISVAVGKKPVKGAPLNVKGTLFHWVSVYSLFIQFFIIILFYYFLIYFIFFILDFSIPDNENLILFVIIICVSHSLVIPAPIEVKQPSSRDIALALVLDKKAAPEKPKTTDPYSFHIRGQTPSPGALKACMNY